MIILQFGGHLADISQTRGTLGGQMLNFWTYTFQEVNVCYTVYRESIEVER